MSDNYDSIVSYFTQRVNQISRDLLEKRKVELFGDNPHGPRAPTWGDVFAAIRSGEIQLKEGTETLTRPYLMPQDVEWPGFERLKAEYEANVKRVDEYCKVLADLKDRAVDEVRLSELDSNPIVVLREFERKAKSALELTAA
jgi:hypothetical protein